MLGTDDCPFAYERELAKTEAHWVSPKIVFSVKFSEWTDEGQDSGTGVHGRQDCRGSSSSVARAGLGFVLANGEEVVAASQVQLTRHSLLLVIRRAPYGTGVNVSMGLQS